MSFALPFKILFTFNLVLLCNLNCINIRRDSKGHLITPIYLYVIWLSFQIIVNNLPRANKMW